MRRGSKLTLLCVCAALAPTALPALAHADEFNAIKLASRGTLAIPGGGGFSEQALYAHDPTISGNGRYVAFDGYIGGYSGVWRRDLQTEEIAPVAVGRVIPNSEECEAAQQTCDASLPSISGDGRYVSFTTTSQLDPGLVTNSQPNVYVRDMDVPETVQEMEAPTPSACETSLEPRGCPFTVVSAVNGGGEGLTYSTSLSAAGAVAASRSAMSANGEKVAFVTTAVSNLAGPATPAEQVAVRNLNTDTTELVSVEYDPATGLAKVPATPVSGSQGSSTFGAALGQVEFPSHRAFGLHSQAGASISADGSTVAWMGQTVYKQARMLAGEQEPFYAEPLWRRIDEGPLTPTRRVSGGSEPENPGCQASGEQSLRGLVGEAALADPCQGPFQFNSELNTLFNASSELQPVPQLSANGDTVAFVATALLASLGQNAGLGSNNPDLYVVDMGGSESRRAALRPLTRVSSSALAGKAPISDFAISPDGSQIAFTTQRISFPLGSPTYVSQPLATPEMSELFDVDLSNDTLTRVTHGVEGEASERPHKEEVGQPPYLPADGALSPSFSGDGNSLAFSSTAANLVAGDGNTPRIGIPTGQEDGTDAFVVQRKQFSPEPVESAISPAPAAPLTAPERRLSVTARSLRDGRVVLDVRVPGKGRLSAAAQGTVPVARSVRTRHGGHTRVVRALSERVAAASTLATPGSEGLTQLTLTLTHAYRSLAARATGLSATVQVAFSAPGSAVLRQKIAVLFIGRASRARTSKRSTRRHR